MKQQSLDDYRIPKEVLSHIIQIYLNGSAKWLQEYQARYGTDVCYIRAPYVNHVWTTWEDVLSLRPIPARNSMEGWQPL